MSIRYLDLSGAVNFWTNIKNYILSKIPTKTSELTNDSGFLTQHQSLSNYVTLNGAQTISGIKTISTHLRFSSTNTRGTAPSANEERDLIDYKDSAGNRISLFETMYYTDKSSKTSIYAYKTTAATGGNIGSIGIGCDASGNVYTYAPTPSSLDNSTKIATTAFVYNTAAKHLAAATNIYVAKVATGNGSGSNTSNYMALTDLRTYLATVHMHSAASSMNGSYNLQILFKAGDSFGDATFDATKMPGVRNLILNTSTGTNSTVNNYSTNSPTFGNINVTGDIAVTMRNLNCTGRISSQYGAQVVIDTYMGISSLMAANSGYLNVAKNMVINVCDAHADYLFLAMNNGILAMWPGATVTINFRQQCYYTRSLFYASSNGTAWIGYSSFKLTGTEPMAVWGGSGTLTGTSETAAATVAKAVTLASGQTFTLAKNATAKVRFTVDNTAANPTLNIGGTGAKPIYWNNAPVQATMLMKNITYDVKYNGSQFVIQNAVKRLTNNDFGVFRSSGNYNQTYNSGSWNFTGWALYYGTGIENSNWRGSHIGNIQQNVSTANNTFPVLICGTANATANTLIAPYFAKGVKINPSTNIVSASGFDGPLTWSGTAFSYIAGNSLYYYSGQPAIANCFEGSSNDFTKFSYPAGGTGVSSSNANIQTLRLDWGNTYWHDIFVSPNNNYLWHRNVVNSDARGWRRIVEENVTGLTDQSWNINIAGTAANVTGTVDIANGGTGATTRLNAVKALTNEAVGTPTHFLAITTNWGKAGYTTVAQAKTVLGITGDMGSHSDSEYVHMSGDETIGGEKTFSDLQIIGYGTQYKGARNAYILPEFSAGYSGLSITTLSFAQTVKIGNFVLDANNKPSLDTSKAYIQIATGESNGVNACVLESRNSTSSSLGTSANKWSKIYGTEYYYGSNNVEFSDKFVTTDTEQIITGTKSFNSVRGIDLLDKTIDLNDCYSTQLGGVIRYYCNTNSGTNNISNIPTNSSFSMISETYRYLSASDYRVKQTHIADNKTRTRYCSNGTWTDWKEIVDTDVNVTNTLATTTKAYITGTTSSSTNTGTQIFDTGVYLSTTAGELVATKFTGALNGTANRATADANGNNISSTYAKVSDMAEMTAEEVIAIANQILV